MVLYQTSKAALNKPDFDTGGSVVALAVSSRVS